MRKNNNNKNTLAVCPTKRGALQPHGLYTCPFQQTLLHNESCEREAEWTHPTGLQRRQPKSTKHPAKTTHALSPACPGGRCPQSDQSEASSKGLKWRLNQSFACTPVFPAVLPSAKAKLLRRKSGILHMIILLLIQYFCQRPLSRKNMHFILIQYFGQRPLSSACFFLIKDVGRNIELRVKLSYVFNIVPYGEYNKYYKYLSCFGRDLLNVRTQIRVIRVGYTKVFCHLNIFKSLAVK